MKAISLFSGLGGDTLGTKIPAGLSFIDVFISLKLIKRFAINTKKIFQIQN